MVPKTEINSVPSKSPKGAKVIDTVVQKVLERIRRGGNPIEDPTREGGMFVDDETIQLVADLDIERKEHGN